MRSEEIKETLHSKHIEGFLVSRANRHPNHIGDWAEKKEEGIFNRHRAPNNIGAQEASGKGLVDRFSLRHSYQNHIHERPSTIILRDCGIPLFKGFFAMSYIQHRIMILPTLYVNVVQHRAREPFLSTIEKYVPCTK